jgi:hypothetical protein
MAECAIYAPGLKFLGQGGPGRSAPSGCVILGYFNSCLVRSSLDSPSSFLPLCPHPQMSPLLPSPSAKRRWQRPRRSHIPSGLEVLHAPVAAPQQFWSREMSAHHFPFNRCCCNDRRIDNPVRIFHRLSPPAIKRQYLNILCGSVH